MKKRILATLLAGCLLLASAVGCQTEQSESTPGGDTQSTSENGDQVSLGDSLTIWAKKQQVDSLNTMFQEKVDEIAEEYNCDITLEIIAYEDMPQKWAAALESGEVPDLTFLTYAEVGQYYADGLLLPVTDVVEAAEEENGKIYDTLKGVVTFEDEMYMIPYWSESQILYWRTDMFEEAGLDSAPTTWEEFRDYAKLLTNADKNIYGAGVGYGKGNSDAEWWTRAVLWAHGASLVDENGKANLVTDEAKEVAQMIYDMYAVDKSIPPSASNWDDAGNNKAYISGQVAMIFNTGSVVNSLQTDYPDIFENTALAPFPSGPEGMFVPGLDDGWAIFSDAKNPDGAKEFVKLIMEKEWYTSWTDLGAPLLLPIYEEVATSGVWTDEKINKPFIDQIENFQYICYRQQYNAKAGEVYNLRIINDTWQKILAGEDITTSLQWGNDQIAEVYGNG